MRSSWLTSWPLAHAERRSSECVVQLCVRGATGSGLVVGYGQNNGVHTARRRGVVWVRSELPTLAACMLSWHRAGALSGRKQAGRVCHTHGQCHACCTPLLIASLPGPVSAPSQACVHTRAQTPAAHTSTHTRAHTQHTVCYTLIANPQLDSLLKPQQGRLHCYPTHQTQRHNAAQNPTLNPL